MCPCDRPCDCLNLLLHTTYRILEDLYWDLKHSLDEVSTRRNDTSNVPSCAREVIGKWGGTQLKANGSSILAGDPIVVLRPIHLACKPYFIGLPRSLVNLRLISLHLGQVIRICRSFWSKNALNRIYSIRLWSCLYRIIIGELHGLFCSMAIR